LLNIYHRNIVEKIKYLFGIIDYGNIML